MSIESNDELGFLFSSCLGALFACVSAIDNLATTVANATFNSIYAATVAWFPGLAFLLAGGLCLIPMSLLG